MKCLVAGGAGFIGAHLCESLLKEGYFVYCTDNLITGEKRNISPFFKNSKFLFIEHDVTQKIPDEVSDASFIFHLASPASPNIKNPKSYINHPVETLLANSLGSYNLLELAKKKKIKFLYTSSSEVYGNPEVSPQSETYFGNVNPNGIRSVYDEGKRFGEAITMGYFRKFGVDIRIVRIFNTYGPKMTDDGRAVPNFIKAAISKKPLTVFGDGTQTRSFCYIDDMVEGIKRSMFTNKTSGQVLNLGNPDERKIIDLAKMILNLTNSKSEIVYEKLPADDPRRRLPDISLAKKLLGWEPRVTLREGLKKTIEYFRNQ